MMTFYICHKKPMGEEMLTVVRVKRFEHGFTLLTIVRLAPDSPQDETMFYALYQGLTFCFVSASLNRTLHHLRELNCVFDSALHVGDDERTQLVSKIAENELINRQLQADYALYQAAVSRHADEMEIALRRDQQMRTEFVGCA